MYSTVCIAIYNSLLSAIVCDAPQAIIVTLCPSKDSTTFGRNLSLSSLCPSLPLSPPPQRQRSQLLSLRRTLVFIVPTWTSSLSSSVVEPRDSKSLAVTASLLLQLSSISACSKVKHKNTEKCQNQTKSKCTYRCSNYLFLPQKYIIMALHS